MMKRFVHKRQTGAALIISLMLLVVMTLLGVSAVTTTTMEEKMAGNIRNKHLSFQAAEAALRAGESYAETLNEDTTFDGTNGLYPRTNAGDQAGSGGAIADFPVWYDDTTGINWQDVGTITDLYAEPQYIIEDFGTSPRDKDCVLEVPPPPGCILPVYRVTARGWGLNDKARTYVQSTYKKL